MRRALQYLPNPWVMLFLLVVMGTLPMWIGSVGLYEYLAIEIVAWCIYAMGYNIALGYTGLPSFGHGAYFGIGAYGMAIYQLNFDGDSLWLGLLIAMVAGGVAGLFVGAFVSHTRGIYFALLTIAFGQLLWFIAIKSRDLTKGEDGLLNLQRLPAEFGFFSIDLGPSTSFYYFTLVVLVVVVVLAWIMVRSRFGSIIGAVRQNEMRTRFVGYDVRSFKWASFAISAAIAGLGGGVFALAQRSAFPDVMSLHWSGIVVMMVIVGGGLISFWGPLLGVGFYFVTRDVVGAVTESWKPWFGLAYVLVMLFQPEGIAGILLRLRGRFLRGREPIPASEARGP